MTAFLMIAWIQALIKAVPGITQKNIGIYQYIKGTQLAKKPRPTYVRPGEIKQLVDTARAEAAGVGLPGQAQTEELLQSDVASVIHEAARVSDPNKFLETVSKAVATKSEQHQKLAIAAAQDFQRRQETLRSALKVGAEYTDKEFDINLYQPYLAAQAAAAAMKGAGLKNIHAGIKGMAGGASSGFGGGSKS